MFRRSGILVMGGLCLVFTSCERIKKQQKDKEALRELTTSKTEMLDSAEMTDEGLVVDMDKVKHAQETLKKSGEKLGGKMGEALKIGAELQENLNETAVRCTKASDEAAAYFEMKSLAATRDYTGGIGKFKALIAINEETLAAFEAFEPELKKRLDAIGLTGDERREFDAGFRKTWTKTSELVKVIRNADIELGKTGIQLLEGLQKGDAHWGWDEDAQSAIFQTDAQVQWYNARMEKIGTLGKTQLKAQEELVQHLRKP
jgi:hypothetical protein